MVHRLPAAARRWMIHPSLVASQIPRNAFYFYSGFVPSLQLIWLTMPLDHLLLKKPNFGRIYRD